MADTQIWHACVLNKCLKSKLYALFLYVTATIYSTGYVVLLQHVKTQESRSFFGGGGLVEKGYVFSLNV